MVIDGVSIPPKCRRMLCRMEVAMVISMKVRSVYARWLGNGRNFRTVRRVRQRKRVGTSWVVRCIMC